MLFYLSKILPLFVLPLGATLILLLAGIVLRRRWLVITAAALPLLAGMPIVSSSLFHAVEGVAERVPATDAPTADAIVVLSVGRVVAPGRAAISEWTDADRFFGGVQLFRAGKAPLLVFTGGWSPFEPHVKLEGEILAEYARQFGVPANAITTTGQVANTTEEALAVAAILRERFPGSARILLVTSAFHMRRAAKLFRDAGAVVAEFPVDFAGDRHRGFGIIDVLPTAGALGQSQAALREMYGRVYHGLMPF